MHGTSNGHLVTMSALVINITPKKKPHLREALTFRCRMCRCATLTARTSNQPLRGFRFEASILHQEKSPTYMRFLLHVGLSLRDLPAVLGEIKSKLSSLLCSSSNEPSVLIVNISPKKKPHFREVFSLVEHVGLEPTTPCLQSRCSSQLS